jgi:hypothetical protein
LLKQRVLDLKRLSTEYNFRDAIDKKRYIRLALMAMANIDISNRAVKAIWRRLRRTFS